MKRISREDIKNIITCLLLIIFAILWINFVNYYIDKLDNYSNEESIIKVNIEAEEIIEDAEGITEKRDIEQSIIKEVEIKKEDPSTTIEIQTIKTEESKKEILNTEEKNINIDTNNFKHEEIEESSKFVEEELHAHQEETTHYEEEYNDQVEEQDEKILEEIKTPPITQPTSKSTYKSSYDGSLGSVGALEGNTIIISIFVNDATTKWSNSDLYLMNTALSKLSSALTYLSNQASNYGKKATFTYNWNINSDLKYTANFSENLVIHNSSLYNTQKNWIINNIDSSKLKNKYKADNILYLFLFNTNYSNPIKPWSLGHLSSTKCDIELSNIFMKYNNYDARPVTFAHEILHSFGAPDLYKTNNFINRKYIDYLKSIKSKDIMYTVTDSNEITNIFSELDAYYVGLTNYSKDVSTWGLGKSEHVR